MGGNGTPKLGREGRMDRAIVASFKHAVLLPWVYTITRETRAEIWLIVQKGL